MVAHKDIVPFETAQIDDAVIVPIRIGTKVETETNFTSVLSSILMLPPVCLNRVPLSPAPTLFVVRESLFLLLYPLFIIF